MADDKNPDVKSAGGEDTPAPKKKAGRKKIAKKAAKKKVSKKKTAAKKTVKNEVAAKKVVKKGPPKRPTPAVALTPAVRPQPAEPAAEPPAPAESAKVRQQPEQTSTTESRPPAPTHRFWPKVILWVIVILVGFMIIRSLATKDEAEEQAETAGPAVEQQAAAPEASAAVAEKPGETRNTPEPAVPAEEAAEMVPVAGKMEEASPVKPAPVVADKASEPAPAAADMASEPAPVAAGEAGEPAPVAADEAGEPAPVAADEAGEPAPAAADTVSEPAPVVSQKAPEPALQEPVAPAPATKRQVAPGTPLAGRRQSQSMAEYRAMRRAAQEERRKMYERMRRQSMQAPWGGGRGQRPYYANPYYGNPYQPRDSN